MRPIVSSTMKPCTAAAQHTAHVSRTGCCKTRHLHWLFQCASYAAQCPPLCQAMWSTVMKTQIQQQQWQQRAAASVSAPHAEHVLQLPNPANTACQWLRQLQACSTAVCSRQRHPATLLRLNPSWGSSRPYSTHHASQRQHDVPLVPLLNHAQHAVAHAQAVDDVQRALLGPLFSRRRGRGGGGGEGGRR
jgi:hypothetical protein